MRSTTVAEKICEMSDLESGTLLEHLSCMRKFHYSDIVTGSSESESTDIIGSVELTNVITASVGNTSGVAMVGNLSAVSATVTEQDIIVGNT